MVVIIKDLTFCYKSKHIENEVLKGINLQISPGEIVILTGPSGSGKTTLLTLIGALRNPQKGQIHVLGYNLSTTPSSSYHLIRQKIGYIFQNHNLIKSLTALQNVCMPLELSPNISQKERDKIGARLLDSVGLKDYLHNFPNHLSGGQKQRVSIARALSRSPSLILADEPTASLDKKTGHECAALLKNLAKEKKTAILLVTHDNRILDIADRVISLEEGRIQ